MIVDAGRLGLTGCAGTADLCSGPDVVGDAVGSGGVVGGAVVGGHPAGRVRPDRRAGPARRAAGGRRPALQGPGGRQGVGLPVAAALAWNEAAAAVFSRGATPPRRFDRPAARGLRSRRGGHRGRDRPHGDSPDDVAVVGAGRAGQPGNDRERVDEPPDPAVCRCSGRAGAPAPAGPGAVPVPMGSTPCAWRDASHRRVGPRQRRPPAATEGAGRAAGRLASAGPVTGRVDWSQVALFRSQASDRLGAALAADRAAGSGRAAGTGPVDHPRSVGGRGGGRDLPRASSRPAAEQAAATAVFDALFGLGRLQPLVDDDRVENISITGHDNVRLELTDGTIIPAEPVADSDQDLIDFLVFLASRSEVNARPFSPAVRPAASAAGRRRPAGGGGVGDAAAVGGDPPAPAAAGQPGRSGGRGALTPVAASFLSAAVKARK